MLKCGRVVGFCRLYDDYRLKADVNVILSLTDYGTQSLILFFV